MGEEITVRTIDGEDVRVALWPTLEAAVLAFLQGHEKGSRTFSLQDGRWVRVEEVEP